MVAGEEKTESIPPTDALGDAEKFDSEQEQTRESAPTSETEPTLELDAETHQRLLAEFAQFSAEGSPETTKPDSRWRRVMADAANRSDSEIRSMAELVPPSDSERMRDTIARTPRRPIGSREGRSSLDQVADAFGLSPMLIAEHLADRERQMTTPFDPFQPADESFQSNLDHEGDLFRWL